MGYSMLLSTADLAALAFFLAVWVFHALAADGKLFSRVSLSTAMNAQRETWMRTMARRDLRMIDTSIMLGLQQGTAFFGSSALIAIGGCFALLGASDQVLNVLSRPAADDDAVTAGLRDQGDRADPASRLRLLQVRLVVPAVQLLLDPDRRGAGAKDEAGACRGDGKGGGAGSEDEHPRRQALQCRPARHLLLNRLPWVVRRPAGLRPVHPAAALRSGPAAVLLRRPQGRPRDEA